MTQKKKKTKKKDREKRGGSTCRRHNPRAQAVQEKEKRST